MIRRSRRLRMWRSARRRDSYGDVEDRLDVFVAPSIAESRRPLLRRGRRDLLVGAGGAQSAATRMPPTTVTYATVGSPPSPWELAAPARRRGPSGVCPRVLRRVRGPSGRSAEGLTRRGRTMRRSRMLVRRWGAPIRSLATSKRRWAPGKGRSSGILEAHGRYLSAEHAG